MVFVHSRRCNRLLLFIATTILALPFVFCVDGVHTAHLASPPDNDDEDWFHDARKRVRVAVSERSLLRSR